MADWFPTEDAIIVSWWEDLPVWGKLHKFSGLCHYLVCWSIWKHRNRVVFDDDSPSVDVVL